MSEYVEQGDTVEREDTVDGGYIFTFRIVMTREDIVTTNIRWLYLQLTDRLCDLIVDAESELILEEEAQNE